MGITRNYLYNVLLQISNILVPLITTPYVTRVLDPSGFGIVSFANSIIQYFILFGTLGLNLYGNRLIAYVRDDREKLSKTFWELFWLRCITVSIASGAYIIFLLLLKPSFLVVYLIQILNLLATVLDLSFLFMGIEEFRIVSLRGFTARLITAGLIFVFVKEKDDFVIYTSISALGNLISQLIVWKFLFRHISKGISLSIKGLFKHLPGSLKLFVPLIAIQVYTILDRTMLGILSSKDQVGIYTPGLTLVKTALSLITALGTVMLPRISNLVSNRREDLIKNYAVKTFGFVTYAGLFLTLALYLLTPDFVPIFFGKEFQPVLHVIKVVCPIVLFISWSNFFGIQLMVPMQLEKEFTLSVFIGAITNFSLNLFLISKYGAIGASIATVFAEFLVTLSQMMFIRKIIDVPGLLRNSWKHFLSAFGTLVIYLTINRWISFGGSFSSLLINGVLLTVSYMLIEKLLRSEINELVLGKVKISLKKVFH
ncbi:flippase [Pseudothermotoga elfii]|uniref:flippase n=1 Tax=Pseudothermotoga elfii TaxID=38322 RepID=UPI00040BA0FE|nr:flippase [Pseudothermotoga elfii]